mmetsp:Transcript_66614/g.135108  ORF Transcript_66614/g.135108 Transcript_66614/m.135108 type:complete len:87 (+) Transcript_66614:166-426(+)
MRTASLPVDQGSRSHRQALSAWRFTAASLDQARRFAGKTSKFTTGHPVEKNIVNLLRNVRQDELAQRKSRKKVLQETLLQVPGSLA